MCTFCTLIRSETDQKKAKITGFSIPTALLSPSDTKHFWLPADPSVPKWPLFEAFRNFDRLKPVQKQLKNHLFEHPKWFGNNFGKKHFSLIFHPHFKMPFGQVRVRKMYVVRAYVHSNRALCMVHTKHRAGHTLHTWYIHDTVHDVLDTLLTTCCALCVANCARFTCCTVHNGYHVPCTMHFALCTLRNMHNEHCTYRKLH